MSAHTPGPWHWDGPVHNYNPKEEAPWLVNDADDWVLKGEIQCFGEANARLIAAAPDMLDALRRAALALAFAAESSKAMQDDYNAVAAAIAKATGIE